MSAFVILAAGRGTRMARVGGNLHKALVPLNGRAIISHIIEKVPLTMNIIVAIGHNGQQIKDYLQLAHPSRSFLFVSVPGWDRPGGGPGASLLACRDVVGDQNMYFTSCDTIWEDDPELWEGDYSWMGVAPMPTGTHPSRWCRIATGGKLVSEILDKTVNSPEVTDTYVGLAHVACGDLDGFWSGIDREDMLSGERQVSGGFTYMIEAREVHVKNVVWTDVGDEQAYAQAVAQHSGYDWTKLGQATYVLPQEDRVVKYSEDNGAIENRRVRAAHLGDAVPKIVGWGPNMLAYEYIHGDTAYTSRVSAEVIWAWYEEHFTRPVSVPPRDVHYHSVRFYRDKTLTRIEMLSPHVRNLAADAVAWIDWDQLALGTRPVIWHGDLNYGNIIVRGRVIHGIDWREDFDGVKYWGDARYDIAKLIAGTVVHWENAQRGDMRPWPEGRRDADVFRSYVAESERFDIEAIGALSLINSAPLHASPLDEVLVARGCAWLERIKSW